MPSSGIAPGILGTRVPSGMMESPGSTAKPIVAQCPAAPPGRRWSQRIPTCNLTPAHSARRVEQGRAKALWCCLSRAHPAASALSGVSPASSQVQPGLSEDSAQENESTNLEKRQRRTPRLLRLHQSLGLPHSANGTRLFRGRATSPRGCCFANTPGASLVPTSVTRS